MPEIKTDLFAIGPENIGLRASLIADQLTLTMVASCADLARMGDVRFGSKADMCGAQRNVRFTPEGRHVRSVCSQECAGFWSLFSCTPNQRPVQLGYRLRQLIVMQNIVLRYTTNCRSQFAQNVSEQAKVDMHVN